MRFRAPGASPSAPSTSTAITGCSELYAAATTGVVVFSARAVSAYATPENAATAVTSAQPAAGFPASDPTIPRTACASNPSFTRPPRLPDAKTAKGTPSAMAADAASRRGGGYRRRGARAVQRRRLRDEEARECGGARQQERVSGAEPHVRRVEHDRGAEHARADRGELSGAGFLDALEHGDRARVHGHELTEHGGVRDADPRQTERGARLPEEHQRAEPPDVSVVQKRRETGRDTRC